MKTPKYWADWARKESKRHFGGLDNFIILPITYVQQEAYGAGFHRAIEMLKAAGHSATADMLLEKFVDETMAKISAKDWRYHWCGAGSCACMGCANRVGGVESLGVTKEQWEAWVERNPKSATDTTEVDFWIYPKEVK